MGLLDDAIREHLDLKRRSGGDPAEIARAEQEALGPVRREAEPPATAESEAHEAPAPTHHDEAHQDPPPHAPASEGEALFDAHPHDPAPDEPEPEPGPEPAVHDPEPALAKPHDPRHTDVVHQPTTEYRIEDQHDASDDDVLEETPDFLQETPEHDRLWFEQRPPRDFDFDG
jgi:hypothetical protein